MNRLDFLKKALFGASALVVAPKILLAEKSRPSDEFVKFAKEFSDKANLLKTPHTLERPYIVELSNPFDFELKNIDIWGYNYLGLLGIDNKYATRTIYPRIINKITFSSSFTTGLIILESETANQILQELVVYRSDANGYGQWTRIRPLIDPYQTEHRAIALRTRIDFDINVATHLVLSKLLPKSVVKISIYPINKSGEGMNIEDVLHEKLYI